MQKEKELLEAIAFLTKEVAEIKSLLIEKDNRSPLEKYYVEKLQKEDAERKVYHDNLKKKQEEADMLIQNLIDEGCLSATDVFKSFKGR